MYTNLPTSQGYIFRILQHFATKLCSFSNFDNFFPEISFVIPRSKIFLKRKSFIESAVSLNFHTKLSTTFYRFTQDEVEILTHQSIEDRLEAAQKFSSVYCSQTSIRMFVDSMKNEASRMYGVNAIRLYVLHNETVVYEGGVGPTHYNTEEVRKAIRSRNSSCVVV